MNELKRDMARIQTLVGDAFNQTGGLVALSDGGQMAPEKLQRTLEQTMDHFERSTLELRRLCETYSPGAGGYQRKRPPLQSMQPDTWNSSDMAGSTSYSAHCCPIAAIRPRPGSAIPSPACSTIMKGPAASCPISSGLCW